MEWMNIKPSKCIKRYNQTSINIDRYFCLQYFGCLCCCCCVWRFENILCVELLFTGTMCVYIYTMCFCCCCSSVNHMLSFAICSCWTLSCSVDLAYRRCVYGCVCVCLCSCSCRVCMLDIPSRIHVAKTYEEQNRKQLTLVRQKSNKNKNKTTTTTIAKWNEMKCSTTKYVSRTMWQ